MRIQKKTRGFGLLEFLAVMVLVAVLALIAIPIFMSYLNQGKFTDVVQQGDTYKASVEQCIQTTSDITKCNSGDHGIPEN